MALVSKSVDELTTELVDVYDSLIAPKKVWRSHNNKLYLILRSFAAGMAGINDAALALHNRFNPLLCDDAELYSLAKLVGTEFKSGTGSMVDITVLNKDTNASKTLVAGRYCYNAADGTIFSFDLATDCNFEPERTQIITAISQLKGKFHVSDNRSVKVYRSDGASIDKAFSFSCRDNIGQLGYADETPFEFRSRIINHTDRQDVIKRLELSIRNLPNIFECNLVINEDVVPQDYDGLTLAPKEVLITITGVPTDDIARLVCESILYDTHCVDPKHVVWYYNDLYITGRRPIYYRFHNTLNFSITVSYQYNSLKFDSIQIEGAIKELFKPYEHMATHLSTFSEKDAYKVLEKCSLQGIEILAVDIFNASGQKVSYIHVPKTRLLCLVNLSFTAIDTQEVL